MSSTSRHTDLRELVASREWYHTLELAPGVVTPGWFDTRKVATMVPLPASLAGKRCLDVGTFDGFWAFEMERRGADEVVAIDILDPHQWDWPPGASEADIAAMGTRKDQGRGFEIAADALASKVDRREMSVYDLDRDVVGGFDFVYVGSLLLHLRDPVRALERAASVCDGELLVVDAVNLPLSVLARHTAVAALEAKGRPWWWKPNLAGLARMVEAAGLEIRQGPQRLFMPSGPGQPPAPLTPRRLVRPSALWTLLLERIGDPHAAVLATPKR